jgi:hypothetical protein
MSFHLVSAGDGAAQKARPMNVYDIAKRPKSAFAGDSMRFAHCPLMLA